ncbi:MAG: putative selenium-dependent hydroxylase accessory protein YqeC [Clostridiales bacterium]|nr:MAG: putative selenium-dependent hydroxylase accessory protein YqeC [Clostridiales bacterium]
MKVNYKIWIENAEKFYGVGPHQLLKGVAQSGSLSDSAKAMKISYKKALTVIARAEDELGFKLLDRKIGGASGGGSRLTAQGERWLAQFESLQASVRRAIEDQWADFCNRQFNAAIVTPLRNKMDSGQSVLLSIIGAGGKTTLLNQLWDSLSDEYSTLYTTTTKVKARADIETYYETAPAHSSVALYGARIGADKVQGVSPAALNQLHALKNYQLIICEADGARRMPFKVHAAHEPVVPEQSTEVYIVVGCDAFVKPAVDALHRHQLIDIDPNQPIAVDRAIQYICQTVLAKLPAAANISLLFNKYGQYGLPISMLELVRLVEKYSERPIALLTAELKLRQVFHVIEVYRV